MGCIPWLARLALICLSCLCICRVYFDACDGFFTNYNWKEVHLLRTREVANSRQTDVYVGVDVFGRGDVVSSGFDTKKVGWWAP